MHSSGIFNGHSHFMYLNLFYLEKHNSSPVTVMKGFSLPPILNLPLNKKKYDKKASICTNSHIYIQIHNTQFHRFLLQAFIHACRKFLPLFFLEYIHIQECTTCGEGREK